MKPTVMADLVLDRLSTIDGIDVLDGGVLRTPQRPYVVLHGGVTSRDAQRYGDATPRERWSYSVMVVNNSAAGCRLLADRVADLLDDHTRQPVHPDGLLSVYDYDSGPPIADDEVEGAWRWSITVYFIARED